MLQSYLCVDPLRHLVVDFVVSPDGGVVVSDPDFCVVSAFFDGHGLVGFFCVFSDFPNDVFALRHNYILYLRTETSQVARINIGCFTSLTGGVLRNIHEQILERVLASLFRRQTSVSIQQ